MEIKHNLRIYNTLSRKKEKFIPLKNKGGYPIKSAKGGAKQFNRVNMFACGPTVYDFPHIGHARTYVVFDSFAKYLKHIGFKVFYLQNITDVDDKIIARAREKGVLPKSLTKAFEKEYYQSMKNLKVDSITKYARATDHIKEIISQIKRLEKAGYAYTIEDGVYFNIKKFKNYGKLANRTALLAEDAVSRIDYSKDKKNRGDFCLWKFSGGQTTKSFDSNFSEPVWQSPFGKGRPGWHIEDTAIVEKFFGPQIDIHGGARDLIFPHHEAEIAQMEGVSKKAPYSKYWMHTGFLTTKGQKMSKSLKNFVMIDEFLKKYSYRHLRYLVLKNLWRNPFDYSESAMVEVRSALERIEEFLIKIKDLKTKSSKNKNKKLIDNAKKYFYFSLDDDFNTPKALAVVFDLIKETNKAIDKNLLSKKEAKEIYIFFEKINQIFEIIDFKEISKKRHKTIPSKVKKLVDEREKYRKEINWQMADKKRAEIEKIGYKIEDTREGPIITKKD